jgi:predicted MFS family arabinose efflux permease
VGGLLVEYVDWRSIFYINLGIGAVAVAAAFAFVDESSDDSAQRLDLVGAALLASALFFLVWAIVKTTAHAWGSTYTVTILLAAAALGAACLLRLTTARNPLVPLSFFRNLSLDAGVIVIVAIAFTLFGFLFYLMLYLQRVHGYSPVAAGLRILPLTGLVGLSAPAGGALGGRLPLRLQLFAGLGLVAGSMLGLTGISPSSSFGSLWPWFLMAGAGVGLTMTGGTQAVLGSAPVENAGIAAGAQQTAIQLGAALGTAVLGSVVTSRVGQVLPKLLTSARVPHPVAARMLQAKSVVAQGLVPVSSHASSTLAHAVTAASYRAVTDGMHSAFILAACVAGAGALLALACVKNPRHAAGAAAAL